MKSKVAFLLFSIFLQLLVMKIAHAQNGIDFRDINLSNDGIIKEEVETVCKKIQNSDNKKKKLTFGLVFNALYRKNSFVEIKNLESEFNTQKTQLEFIRGGLFVDFISVKENKSLSKLKKYARALRSKIKIIKSEIRINDFIEQIEKDNVESCTKQLEEYLHKYNDYIVMLFEFKKKLSVVINEIVGIMLTKHLRQYVYTIKRTYGISVRKATTFVDLYKVLESKKFEQVVIVGHATSEGVLVGFNGEFIPKGYFNSLRGIKRLIIFSCYRDEVVKYYGLDKLNYEVYVTSVKEKYADFFQNKVPAFSIGKISNILRKKTLIKTKNAQCQVYINLKENNNDLEVYINNYFLGVLNQDSSFDFPCNYLKNVNLLTLKIGENELINTNRFLIESSVVSLEAYDKSYVLSLSPNYSYKNNELTAIQSVFAVTINNKEK